MKWKGSIDFNSRPEYGANGLITTNEVDTISGSLQTNIDSQSEHSHDDRYYTESEVDTLSGTLQENIDEKSNVVSLLDLSDTPSLYDVDKYLRSTISGTEWATVSGGSGGISDHGNLTGLADDDHTQYLLADGTRDVNGNLTVSGRVSTARIYPVGGIESAYIGLNSDIIYINSGWKTVIHIDGNADEIIFNPAATWNDVDIKIYGKEGAGMKTAYEYDYGDDVHYFKSDIDVVGVVSASEPTVSGNLTTKHYVDGKLGNVVEDITPQLGGNLDLQTYKITGEGGTEGIYVDSDGNVGVGTTTQSNPLVVNRSADGIIVDFESGGIVEGNVSISGSVTSYNAFVGSHYTQLMEGQSELQIGAVVISTGKIVPCGTQSEITEVIIGKEDVTLKTMDTYVNEGTGAVYKIPIGSSSAGASPKEYFPYVDTTSIGGDKRVYGVWFGKISDDARDMSFGQDDKPVYLISQVGLFKIRVTDSNGDIENGDYLEASKRPMEAQRQDSQQKINSTIGKALIDVNWEKEEIDKSLGYKWKLIPCVF